MLGYENSSELLGKQMHALIHHSEPDGSHYPAEKCHIYQAIREKQESHIDDEVLWRKDGSSFHAEYWFNPIVSQGHVTGAVVSFLDISERKQTEQALQKSEEKNRLLVENSLLCIHQFDTQGRISSINPAGLRMMGVAEEKDVVGQNYMDFVVEEDYDRVQGLLQAALKGKPSVYEIKLITGQVFSSSFVPIFSDDGTVIRIMGQTVDITKRRKIEEELEDHRNHLEQQVRERTAELEQKGVELARATQLKSDFLANMSHELRTPMNSIIGFTDQVIKRSADKLAPLQLNNLRNVEQSAHHLLDLINGLLDLSKIEAGKMEVYAETFDFATLVQEVFHLTQPMLEDKPVELKTDLLGGDIQLHTDHIKLKQVLINLVSNAIKFTQQGSITIAAKLVTTGRSGSQPQISICVTDTGVGMNKKARHYIFEAFCQGDGSLARQMGGTGLGLAIVRSFTELLGGSISVASEEGAGTTFEMVIPVNLNRIETESAGLQTPPRQPRLDSDNKLTVLCIDEAGNERS